MGALSAGNILLLILWLGLVPLFTGYLVTTFFPAREKTAGLIWLMGLLTDFAVFEPIAIACMFNIVYDSFLTCVRIYRAAALILAGAGAVLAAVNILRGPWREAGGVSYLITALFPGYGSEKLSDLMHPRRDAVRFDRRFSVSEAIYTGLFIVLLVIQLVCALYFAPFDGDDAYYVVESVLSDQTDTINTVLPYTGYSTTLDLRHALATWTIWIAFIARVSGVHAAILSHTILPLVLIPACYYAFYRVAARLLKRRSDLIPLFLSFICLFSIYGNVSIYTRETFFLMRTWQGKAMTGSLVIPLIFSWLLGFAEDETGERWTGRQKKERFKSWTELFLTVVAAGFFSTSGIMVSTMLLASGVCFVVLFSGWRGTASMRQRLVHKFSALVLAGLTCVPNAVLVVLRFVMRG